MNNEQLENTDSKRNCPSCGKELAEAVVLCVACGYHLKLGHHLSTFIEKKPETPIDPNPYAPPVETESEYPTKPKERTVFDLTEYGAKQAQAVVSDAQSVFLVVALAWCICTPAWLVMFPWYGYRLYCWYGLNQQFSELRNPNSFSPHGELAGNFQDARFKLWFGFIAGLIVWILVAIVFLLDLLGYLADARG